MITCVDIGLSLDRFSGISNLSFSYHDNRRHSYQVRKHGKPQVFRANGLQPWSVLGLLFGMVGLLRSCVDYQEVIVSVSSGWSRGNIIDVSH
jgi:hypothetical protein